MRYTQTYHTSKKLSQKIQNAQRGHKPRIFFTTSRVDFSRIFRPMSNYTKIKVTLFKLIAFMSPFLIFGIIVKKPF